MKTYDLGKLRNLGIIAHGGAGKTSLAEACLFNVGAINRLGKVSDGNTVSDYLPEEVKHQVSISTSVIPCEWKEHKINFLDTPGYSDFFGEVKSTLRVAEGALLVLCGVGGLEVQAEILWEYTDSINLPKVVFINKLDRENSSFEKVLQQISSVDTKAKVLPVQIPIGSESNFTGVVDVLTQQAFIFEKNGSGKFNVGAVPTELTKQVEELRESLAEAVAEVDDDLLTKYLEGEPLTSEELQLGLRKAVVANMVVPVLCGSSLKNIGVQPLMDFLIDYMPSPALANNGVNETAALVFKTLADPFVGKLSYFRVYGGTIKSDSTLYNSLKQKDEKIGQVFLLRGKNQEPVAEVRAGDIAAIAKLQDTSTGDTLTYKEKPIILENIEFPIPCLTVAIEPKSKGDEDKLGTALARLVEEDPTISIGKNTETREMLLTGMGEMHLEIVQEKLSRKFGVGVNMRAPKIPYRESLRKMVQVEGKHKKQSGGHGQYGHVWIKIEPSGGKDFEFSEEIFGGSVPRQYFPAVEKGIREAMAEGVIAGFPVTDVKVTLYDGSYHTVDSSEMAFKLAAILAFRKGAELAKPTILEPIMNVEVSVPEVYMGDVIGDLNGKRGKVLGMDQDGRFQSIRALVPLAEMMRYSIDLKSLTQGRGSFKMEFSQYEEVPSKLSESIVAAAKTS
ncbi:MAG TPA: elongation factor G [Candidatus Deferrimicrobium sp.]|nr:elongation factor G [Candidatus Deferrimicrobium sp.]